MPDSYPKSAPSQLEHDQQFIDDLTQQLKTHLYKACERNTSPGAKPKSSDSKIDLIYKRAFCNYL